MLQHFIPRLVHEMELEDTTLSSGVPGIYTLPLGDGIDINMTDIPNGYILKSNVAPFPKVKEELFLERAMLGNLFGQGTKGAVLGLNLEGSMLTLTRVIDFPVEYKDFKESLEDFINTIDLWREEAQNPTA